MFPNTLETIARQLTDSQKRLEALEHQRSGSNRLIDSFVLTGAVASLTFSNIPNIYDHLLILYYVKSDFSATVIHLRFNADVGANYDHLRLIILHPATLATAEGIAGTSIELPAIVPLAPANAFDEGMLIINHYANSANQKAALAMATFKLGLLTGNFRFQATSGWWRSNAAITSMTLFLLGGSNFDTGSRFDLYGIQGGE